MASRSIAAKKIAPKSASKTKAAMPAKKTAKAAKKK
jgi:hypothetical protein